MYACETSLAYSVKDIKDITNVTNSELEMIWLHGNKLSVNVDKTTSMLLLLSP